MIPKLSANRERESINIRYLHFLIGRQEPRSSDSAFTVSYASRTSRRDEKETKRSFRTSICRCLTASIGGATTLIQPKQTLFFTTKGTSMFLAISSNLSSRTLSIVASVPPRRQDKNFLAMIGMFCALLGGKI